MVQWRGEQYKSVGGDQMAGMGGVMAGKWDKTGIKILLGRGGHIILLGEEILLWDKQGLHKFSGC